MCFHANRHRYAYVSDKGRSIIILFSGTILPNSTVKVAASLQTPSAIQPFHLGLTKNTPLGKYLTSTV